MQLRARGLPFEQLLSAGRIGDRHQRLARPSPRAPSARADPPALRVAWRIRWSRGRWTLPTGRLHHLSVHMQLVSRPMSRARHLPATQAGSSEGSTPSNSGRLAVDHDGGRSSCQHARSFTGCVRRGRATQGQPGDDPHDAPECQTPHDANDGSRRGERDCRTVPLLAEVAAYVRRPGCVRPSARTGHRTARPFGHRAWRVHPCASGKSVRLRPGIDVEQAPCRASNFDR